MVNIRISQKNKTLRRSVPRNPKEMVSRSRRQSANHASSEHASKRQKLSSANTSTLTDFFNQTIEKILALDGKGYKIAVDFEKLPSKKSYPDYYEEIDSPISIEEVQVNVASESYSEVDSFINDFQLMADNAIQFNGEESEIAQNALKILEFVKNEADKFKKKNEAAQSKPTPKIKIRLGSTKTDKKPVLTLDQKLSDILNEIIKYKDNGIRISEPFLYEVSREDYPDYYKLIKKGMALKTVEENIKKHKYKTINQFAEDINLIWKNAQLYNEEGSLIHDDSKTLENIFHSRIENLKKSTALDEHTKDTKSEIEDSIGSEREEKSVSKTKEEDESNFDVNSTDNGENAAETPIKKKIGRPKGRPPKPKELSPIAPPEPEDILNQELGENLLENSVLSDSFESQKPSQQPIIHAKPIDPVIRETKEAIPILLGTFARQPKHKPVPKALIQELAIFSSRSIYRQTVKASINNQLGNIFQNWFEYQFKTTDKRPESYSITLAPSVQGAVSVSAAFNESLLRKKHLAFLTVNGERVNPTPSIHYAETGKQPSSRFELKLATGLNKVVFEIRIDDEFEESDKLVIWVQVL